MNQTENYNLNKPEYTDNVDVAKLNENADIIDAKLKEHSDALELAALGIKYHGEVNYYADLPLDAEIGDAYTVKYSGSSGTTPDGTEYVWGNVGGSEQWIDFSKDCYTRAEVNALLTGKQDTLNAAQLAAVNSGITAEGVAQIETNKNNISWNTNQGVKNLLQNTASSSGIFTVNSDGSVKAYAATATGSPQYLRIKDNLNLPAGNYILSGATGGSTTTYSIVIQKNVSTSPSTIARCMSGDTSFTLDGTESDVGVTISAAQNNTINTTFYPMIRKFGDNSYQPYALSNVELTAKNAVNENNIWGLGTALASNVDLDDITDVGRYYCSGATIGNTLINCPTVQPFIMVVSTFQAVGNRIQRIESLNLSTFAVEIYERMKISSGWKAWTKFEGTQVTNQ